MPAVASEVRKSGLGPVVVKRIAYFPTGVHAFRRRSSARTKAPVAFSPKARSHAYFTSADVNWCP